MIVVTRRYRFPAAHVLANPALSADENDRIFGKCANPNGHGHNYGVEVSVAGPVDPDNGSVVTPDRLDTIFEEAVERRFSHRMLNELSEFNGLVPTAENIAVVLHAVLSPAVAEQGGARLLGIRVEETPRNHFEYGFDGERR